MNTKLVIHPVDLQDQAGFLRFLARYARQGYQASRIYRSFTLFRRTDAPPRAYSMRFDPDSPPLETFRGADKIPGLNNGAEIFPTPGEPVWQQDWAKNVAGRYTDFVPCSISGAISAAARRLALPLLLLLLLLAGDTLPLAGAGSADARSLLFLGIATLLCAAAMVAIEVLAYAVDTLHLRGLKQALETGIPYTIPPARYPLIRVKNFCVMFSVVPSLCLILVLLGYLW